MPFRRVELVADHIDLEDIDPLLDESNATDRRCQTEDETIYRLSFIIDESTTEHVTDKLRERYENAEGFQLMIYELSALWPKPEKVDGQPESEEAERRRATAQER